MKDFDRTISVNEMRAMDQNTTDYGVPIEFLMECAGSSAARTILSTYSLNKESKVLVLCGTGNNGGDGFVVARHLLSAGVNVTLLLVGSPLKIRTKHALLNWKILSNLNLKFKRIVIKDSSFFDAKEESQLNELKQCDVIVDCLLGTGIRGRIREPIRSAIQFIRNLKKANKKIVSVDVPSGVDPDDGSLSDVYIQPDLLITFHRKKLGFEKLNFKIPKIIVNSIGIPLDADLFVGSGDLKVTIKKRNKTNHKGQHGKVLVIGGSDQYSGAPALSAMAALEMDMDLVIVYAPKSVANVIRAYSPNLIVHEGTDSNINLDDIEKINELIEWADSIVLGPGMGLADETKEAVGKILDKCVETQKSVVIDADAIKICKNYKDLLKKSNAIVTPHSGEFTILTKTKLPAETSYFERARVLELVALNYGVTFLVKGRLDYICNGENTRINKTGVPEMAVGGTGDILTGIVASLLATKVDKFTAACVGAYINGKLGEIYKDIHKSNSNGKVETFKSSDLIGIIPIIISKFR
ncbi:MAG: NAD(P)H-hydrate dehydratase [Candidatus Lokiarchaeota archaeon]|nr:NAD(P)H-hydrate dehydratase [Candidatus Lokiarchaeota archaeon]